MVSQGEPAGQALTVRETLDPYEVPGLPVTRPGLEDAYLQLVGAVPTTPAGGTR